jgi:hypothetical protein
LGRALLIALLTGVVLLAAQWPIREIAFSLSEASPRVEGLARDYYDIRVGRIRSASMVLMFTWFIAQGAKQGDARFARDLPRRVVPADTHGKPWPMGGVIRSLLGPYGDPVLLLSQIGAISSALTPHSLTPSVVVSRRSKAGRERTSAGRPAQPGK